VPREHDDDLELPETGESFEGIRQQGGITVADADPGQGASSSQHPGQRHQARRYRDSAVRQAWLAEGNRRGDQQVVDGGYTSQALRHTGRSSQGGAFPSVD
jgi:hypothetical protein